MKERNIQNTQAEKKTGLSFALNALVSSCVKVHRHTSQKKDITHILTNGLEEAYQVPTQVPAVVVEGSIQQEGGML